LIPGILTTARERGILCQMPRPKISSERARELQKLANESRMRNRQNTAQAQADRLLRQLGIEGGWRDADEGMRVAATRVVVQKDMTAWKMLLEQTGNRVKAASGAARPEGPDWNPESGDPCPLCGGNRVTLLLDADTAVLVAEIIHDPNVEARPAGDLEVPF